MSQGQTLVSNLLVKIVPKRILTSETRISSLEEHFGYLECCKTIKTDELCFFQSVARIATNLAKIQKNVDFANFFRVTRAHFGVDIIGRDRPKTLSNIRNE